jgi:hypothetical protein
MGKEKDYLTANGVMLSTSPPAPTCTISPYTWSLEFTKAKICCASILTITPGDFKIDGTAPAKMLNCLMYRLAVGPPRGRRLRGLIAASLMRQLLSHDAAGMRQQR